MNIDQILTEWCYRLPKGYPTVVNGVFTDKEELRILNKLLAEHGEPNYADMPKNTTDQSTLRLSEAAFGKKELIDLINSADLTEKDLIRITRIVDAVGSEAGIIEKLQSQKRFDPKTAKQVFDMATEAGSYNALLEMLNDPSKQIALSDLGLKGNLISKAKDTGVSTEFAREMGSLVPYTSVKMGRYEMFLRLFLRGGQSPQRKGDVEVDGEEMEVKSTISKGSGFRLRGQSGYGSGKSVQQSFLKQMNAIYEETTDGPRTIPEEVLNAYKEQSGQMWYSSKDSWAVLAGRDMIKSGYINREELVQMWAKAVAEVYPGNDAPTLASFLGPAFSNNGDLDVKEAVARLAAYEFTIYREVEGFAYFVAVNHRDDYGFIPSNATGDNLIKIFKGLFTVVSVPNTKNNATSQDSLTQCALA